MISSLTVRSSSAVRVLRMVAEEPGDVGIGAIYAVQRFAVDDW
jgi:hypothetical protein